MMKTAVLYDQECPLCVSLAHFMARDEISEISFFSWQEFARDHPEFALPPHPEQLAVWDGIEMRVGEAAWSWLLHHHPKLQGLRWLAVKLGLAPLAATLFEKSGQGLRRLCLRCPNRLKR